MIEAHAALLMYVTYLMWMYISVFAVLFPFFLLKHLIFD